MRGPTARVTSHARRARSNGRRRAYVVAAVLLGIAACTSPPGLPPGRHARIETIPAGARLTTQSGEVFRTPTVLPLPRGSTQRIELSLPGYAPRRIAIAPCPEWTPLGAMALCTLVPLMSEAEWERVDVVDGRVRVSLEPETGLEDGPQAR